MDISKVYDIGALMQNGAYFPQQPISYAPPDGKRSFFLMSSLKKNDRNININ